jgi:hypothetical protein
MTEDDTRTALEIDRDELPISESWLAEQVRLLAVEDGRGL